MRNCVFLFLIVFIFPSTVLAQIDSCSVARIANNEIESTANQLLNDYPGTLAYFATAGFIIDETDPDSIEDIIAGISVSAIGCIILIDYESCDFVAGRLISLITARGIVCAADNELHCGIC